MFPQTLLVVSSLFCVLGFVSAVVARAAARQARADLRQLRYEMDNLGAQFDGVTIHLRRVEGRQTARIGRDEGRSAPDTLPDPSRDPEAWRAAVRRQAHNKVTKGELQ